MSAQPSVVVTLDGRVHDPRQALLFADELAALRGDGVFETLLVRKGQACLTGAHLRRLVESASLMDLPEPDLAAWRRAIGIAVAEWTTLGGDEGALRLIYSRGREATGVPTAYLTVAPVPARSVAARRDGIAVVVLDRGLAVAAGPMDTGLAVAAGPMDTGLAVAAGPMGPQLAVAGSGLPWLLAGAKTLSYAVNMAALRHAAKSGADDVIFVSTDGYILEGPRSTVVIAAAGPGGEMRLRTPPTSFPILCGTTQQALFDVARRNGYDCDYQPLRESDLVEAQGIWLVSSMTLAARVHTLDGRVLPVSGFADEFAALVDAGVVSDR